jgi:hypothetical protein
MIPITSLFILYIHYQITVLKPTGCAKPYLITDC